MKEGMKYEDIFAMPQENLIQCMQKINLKCKNDEEFKQQLKDNPTETLKKEGVQLQPNIRFQTIQTEEEAKDLPDNVIPFAIQEQKKGALSSNDLKKVAGGMAGLQSSNNLKDISQIKLPGYGDTWDR